MNIVFWHSDSSFKIIDFDISSVTLPGTLRKITYPEGTPLFMSPELERITVLAKNFSTSHYEYDPFKSDVYSLALTMLSVMGVTFSYMKDLRDIFKILEEQREIKKMLNKIFIADFYSDKFIDIISHMLVKDPQRRCSFEFVAKELGSSFPLSMESSLEQIRFSLLERRREGNSSPMSEIGGLQKGVSNEQTKPSVFAQNKDVDSIPCIQRETFGASLHPNNSVTPKPEVYSTPNRSPELEHKSSTNVDATPYRESAQEVKTKPVKSLSDRLSLNKQDIRSIRSELIEDFRKRMTMQAFSNSPKTPFNINVENFQELPIEKVVSDEASPIQNIVFRSGFNDEFVETQSLLRKLKRSCHWSDPVN
jgi:serine/threonine protein kinase